MIVREGRKSQAGDGLLDQGDGAKVAGDGDEIQGVGSHEAATAEVRFGHHLAGRVAAFGRATKLRPQLIEFIVDGAGVERVRLPD